MFGTQRFSYHTSKFLDKKVVSGNSSLLDTCPSLPLLMLISFIKVDFPYNRILLCFQSFVCVRNFYKKNNCYQRKQVLQWCYGKRLSGTLKGQVLKNSGKIYQREKLNYILREPEQAGQVAAAWTQERKLQRQREHPLSLFACSLVASLMGTLRVSEKRRQRVHAQEKEGHECAPKRAQAGTLSKFHTFPWVRERARFLSDCPIFSWLFLGFCLCLPHISLFSGFVRCLSLILER